MQHWFSVGIAVILPEGKTIFHMAFFRINAALKGFAVVSLLATGVVLASPQESKAACTSTADAGANNCATFDPLSSSFVIQEYLTANLIANNYAQFGFQTNGPSLTLSNVAYQFTGESTWNDLGTVGSVSVTSTAAYQALINNVKVDQGLKLRYTVPTGLTVGNLVQSTLLTNNDGVNTAGVLISATNNFAQVDRASVASTSVPGPLPVLGAVSAFSMSRRLRRRIKR